MNALIGICAIVTNIFGQFSKLPDIIHGEHSREKLNSKRNVATAYSVSIIKAKNLKNLEMWETSIFSFFEHIGRMLENLSLYEGEKYYYENYTTKKVLLTVIFLISVNFLLFLLGLKFSGQWIIISFCSSLSILMILLSITFFQYQKRKAVLKYLDRYTQKWDSLETQFRGIANLFLTISEEEK